MFLNPLRTFPVLANKQEVLTTFVILWMLWVIQSFGPSVGPSARRSIGLSVRRPVNPSARRFVGSFVYQCAKGKGFSIINGKRFDWKERDIFCVPSWAWHEHHNLSDTEDACLFQFNDLPVIESLGLFQSMELEENNGHQMINE
jgi:gentisate 1,2-dioxygenase